MNEAPTISICIPAYKNAVYLQRLLNSVAEQCYRNFEVVVTDDSPDTSIANLVAAYANKFPLLYHRNTPALGSPANWNKAISLAKGSWIKIMHDDDWFASADSLQQFADAAAVSQFDFIFSGFTEVELDSDRHHPFVISIFDTWMLRRNPLYLFRTNYIGHPSTTLIRNNQAQWFDERVKWVVDFECYIRLLRQSGGFHSIRKPLICIGVGSEQITKAAFRNPAVEIPENLYLLELLGLSALHNVFVHDYYWRLLRNLRMSNSMSLQQFAPDTKLPSILVRMLHWQQKARQQWLLRSGLYSKCWMLMHWCISALRGL